MDDHVVDEGSLRIEECRILRLAKGKARRAVHRNMLHGGEGSGASEADIAHVADVEDADAGADGHVLVDDATTDRCGALDRHIPAVKLHHLRAHLPMNGVQRGLANRLGNRARNGFGGGQENPGNLELFKLTQCGGRKNIKAGKARSWKSTDRKSNAGKSTSSLISPVWPFPAAAFPCPCLSCFSLSPCDFRYVLIPGLPGLNFSHVR